MQLALRCVVWPCQLPAGSRQTVLLGLQVDRLAETKGMDYLDRCCGLQAILWPHSMCCQAADAVCTVAGRRPRSTPRSRPTTCVCLWQGLRKLQSLCICGSDQAASPTGTLRSTGLPTATSSPSRCPTMASVRPSLHPVRNGLFTQLGWMLLTGLPLTAACMAHQISALRTDSACYSRREQLSGQPGRVRRTSRRWRWRCGLACLAPRLTSNAACALCRSQCTPFRPACFGAARAAHACSAAVLCAARSCVVWQAVDACLPCAELCSKSALIRLLTARQFAGNYGNQGGGGGAPRWLCPHLYLELCLLHRPCRLQTAAVAVQMRSWRMLLFRG